jgi:hypothetical protein
MAKPKNHSEKRSCLSKCVVQRAYPKGKGQENEQDPACKKTRLSVNRHWMILHHLNDLRNSRVAHRSL